MTELAPLAELVAARPAAQQAAQQPAGEVAPEARDAVVAAGLAEGAPWPAEARGAFATAATSLPPRSSLGSAPGLVSTASNLVGTTAPTAEADAAGAVSVADAAGAARGARGADVGVGDALGPARGADADVVGVAETPGAAGGADAAAVGADGAASLVGGDGAGALGVGAFGAGAVVGAVDTTGAADVNSVAGEESDFEMVSSGWEAVDAPEDMLAVNAWDTVVAALADADAYKAAAPPALEDVESSDDEPAAAEPEGEDAEGQGGTSPSQVLDAPSWPLSSLRRWAQVATPYTGLVKSRTPSGLPVVEPRKNAWGTAGVDTFLGGASHGAESEAYADPATTKFPKERLQSTCAHGWVLPAEVDPRVRELYLADEQFQELFGMRREAFEAQAKWRQQAQKKQVGLF